MKILEESVNYNSFFKKLSKAPSNLLMLDYDGVLSPLQKDRHIAKPWAGVKERVEKLLKLENCNVVIISGRVADELGDLLDWKITPEIWGNHGWERLSARGDLLQSPLPSGISEALHQAGTIAKADWDHSLVEIKHAGVVLHHRSLTSEKRTAMHEWVVKNWCPLEAVEGLLLHPIDGGHELRAEAHHKGKAVETLLEESCEGCVCAYLGDDRTDEDAFKALKGKGLSVLVRSELRETDAEIWLKPPEELLDFFEKWEKACQSSS